MDLGQVAADGSQLFPNVWHRVDTQHLHTQVCQEQHIGRHLIKDHRISVVQIPLIGVEGAQHMLFHLLAPDKIAGCRGRKYLGHGLFKFCRNIVGIIALIPVYVLLLPGLGPHSPLVGVRRMIHDHIQAQADASFPESLGESLQIPVCPYLGIHHTEILHRITAVIEGMGHF